MSINRLFSLFVALTLVVVVVLTVRAGNAPSEVASRGPDLSDYAQRHPGAMYSIAKIDLSDYFLRHPESLKAGNAMDLSDYYQRHPALARPADTAASDWFERHPEIVNPDSAADFSDYYQRHPGVARR